MLAPSVQFVKVYPTAGTALTVTEAPELNEPPPPVVPPNNGLDESATVNCAIIAVKFATNSEGTAYGNEETFKTATNGVPDSVTDSSGNVYNTVTIGTQVWMAENLKTTKYNDGTDIPNVTDGTIWQSLNSGAYCWYNDDIGNKTPYGALYNWYTINTGKLAPIGWHIPTDAEWTTLTDFLGGVSIAGDKLKEAGTSHWPVPNTGATNEIGFTGLPAGYRYVNGTYYYGGIGGISAFWWSSTEQSTDYAWSIKIGSFNSLIDRNAGYEKSGYSVRCIKD